MRKHLEKVSSKNSFLTGRDIQQNHAEGGAAICLG